MKAVLCILVAAVAVVHCGHMFAGTNINRTMVHHQNVVKNAKVFRKAIENHFYMLPTLPNRHRVIQGILAVDMTGTTASANVTQGGLGYNFVNIRMKSMRGFMLHYDIYIYA